MDQGTGALSFTSKAARVVLVIVAAVVLYYIYQYLFSAENQNEFALINDVVIANQKPSTFPREKAPILVQGGDYSFSMWVYVSEWNYRQGNYKHIFSIGNKTQNTITIFLGKFTNSLHVRCDVNDQMKMKVPDYDAIFSNNMDKIAEEDFRTPCDVPSLDLQKWVLITVTISGKTLDVYLDGKLARSCILPGVPLVAMSDNYTATVTDKGGFGGFISNVRAYDHTLNPEQIWKLYMAGPGPQLTLWETIKALFNPASVGTLTYPKYPIGGPSTSK